MHSRVISMTPEVAISDRVHRYKRALSDGQADTGSGEETEGTTAADDVGVDY